MRGSKYDEKTRLQAVALSLSGAAAPAIAQALDVPQRTVRDWLSNGLSNRNFTEMQQNVTKIASCARAGASWGLEGTEDMKTVKETGKETIGDEESEAASVFRDAVDSITWNVWSAENPDRAARLLQGLPYYSEEEKQEAMDYRSSVHAAIDAVLKRSERYDRIIETHERFAEDSRTRQQKGKKQARPVCGAKTRAGGTCQARAVPGKRRCRLHGGASTGPKTKEGRERIAEANRKRVSATDGKVTTKEA